MKNQNDTNEIPLYSERVSNGINVYHQITFSFLVNISYNTELIVRASQHMLGWSAGGNLIQAIKVIGK